MDIRHPSGQSWDGSFGETIDDYFNDPIVKQQMNVADKGDKVIYSGFNNTVYKNMRFDGIVDDVPLYEKIVNSGIKTIVYTGSFDGLDGVLGTQLWVNQLSIASLENSQPKSVYHYVPRDTNHTVIGGTYRNYEKKVGNITTSLSYVTVYNAGHVLGITQFPVSKALLIDLMTDGQPQCHHPDGKC